MRLELPIVIVNFKSYPEATGDGAAKLAKIIEGVAKKAKVSAAVCPQLADVYRIVREVKIPVLAQHIDPIVPGKNTGWISSESVKAAGAIGTLVNHSEHKLQISQVERVVARAREVGLFTVACAADVDESRKIAGIGPDMIAVEPPELISTGIPVSKAKPEVVENSVRAVKNVNKNISVLCGAGITTGDDVKKAIELGAEGVLIASGVVCAKDQKAAIKDIVEGMLAA